MNIGILGFGLIGGSLARAYAKNGHVVHAADMNDSILGFTQLSDIVHGKLDETISPYCHLILQAI